MDMTDWTYLVRFLREEHFADIIKLGEEVHGKNYLSEEELHKILYKSTKNKGNCSFILSVNRGDGKEELIGFRLTYAPDKWIDSFPLELQPGLWGFEPNKVAYLKSNTIAKEFRGRGFGKLLLNRSVAECKRMGADAAVTHAWLNSPDNMAYRYLVNAGAKPLISYPAYWNRDYQEFNYICSFCGENCSCPATEMILDLSILGELIK